jgi:hypothetical protein
MLLLSILTSSVSQIFLFFGVARAATTYELNISSTSGGSVIEPGEGIFTFVANQIDVTITDYGTGGLDFGNLDPGADRQPEVESPSITIKNNGSSNVTVSLMGTVFTGAAGTFSVTNAFYNDTDDSGTALAMLTTYDDTAWKEIEPGDTLNIYHWLSIPVSTPPGNYSSEFTYKTDEAL